MMARTSRHLEKSGRLEGGVMGTCLETMAMTLDPHRKSGANRNLPSSQRPGRPQVMTGFCTHNPEVFWVAEWPLWAESWRMAGTS